MDSSERTIIGILTNLKRSLATAESCTGGLISKMLTDVDGSSAVFDRGFVTYSNKAKQEMIGVPADMIEKHGAVSWQVAEAMAQGTLKTAQTDLAVSCTGIAGPGGGSVDKPVGTVFIGVASSDGYLSHHHHVFEGDRASVRNKTAQEALSHVLKHIKRNYLNETVDE